MNWRLVRRSRKKNILVVTGGDMNLYHISFREVPTGIWHPKLPDGSVDSPTKDSTGKYPEPDVARICVAETLAGCFYAVYPNVSFYFEQKKFPWMDFFYYKPVIQKKTRVWTPGYLTKQRMVWDAHLTKEHAILDPVVMTLAGRVRFFNTSNQPWIKTRPFNDESEKELEVAPPARHRIIETYRTVSKEELPASYNW
jgi:hypothetical protein